MTEAVRKAPSMTYADPFTHNATDATPVDVVTNPNAVYTVVTEAEDYLGIPAFGTDDDDLDHRYDTVQHLAAPGVAAYANTLADDGREVAIFQGRLSTPANFPRNIPVGYVYPGRIWRQVTR